LSVGPSVHPGPRRRRVGPPAARARPASNCSWRRRRVREDPSSPRSTVDPVSVAVMATRRTRLASLFLTLVALTLSTFGLAAQNASSSLHRPDAGGRDAIASATPVVIAL